MQKTDLRVIKTKALLRSGLTQLMTEKPINEVTVKQLTELVQINRGTFYLHYKDVYDLLEGIEQDLLEEIITVLEKHSVDYFAKQPQQLLTDLFICLKNNDDLVSVLLGPNGDMKFVSNIRKIIQTRCFNSVIEKSNLKNENYAKYFYAYISDGVISLYQTWSSNGFMESPHEIAQLAGHLIVYGGQSLIS